MSLQIVFVLSLARVVSSVNRSSLAEGERDRAGVLLPTVFITTEEGRRTSEEHMQLTLEELECVGRGVLPEPCLATAKSPPGPATTAARHRSCPSKDVQAGR